MPSRHYAEARSTVPGQPLDPSSLRFHLAIDVNDRVPRLRATSGAVRERLRNMLIEHTLYIRQHGEDLPEGRDRSWRSEIGPREHTSAPERTAPED